MYFPLRNFKCVLVRNIVGFFIKFMSLSSIRIAPWKIRLGRGRLWPRALLRASCGRCWLAVSLPLRISRKMQLNMGALSLTVSC